MHARTIACCFAIAFAASACNDAGLRSEPGRGNLRVSPASLFFPASGETKTVVLSNDGDAAVAIHAVALSATCESCFSEDFAEPVTLAPGDVLAVAVTFAGAAGALAQSGALTVESSDADAPSQSVALTSAGSAPALACSPAPVALSAIAGETDEQPVTCRNEGDLDLTITAAAMEAGSAASLSFDDASLPLTLAPGGAAETGIARFAPAAAGNAQGSVVLTLANAVDVLVPVTALASAAPACSLAVTPSFVSFGSTKVGLHDARVVTLFNGGAAACALGTPSLTGSGYSLESATPATLLPGASQTLTLRYAPPSRGAHAGSLTLPSNDPQSPVTLPIQGIGVAPELEILGCPLSFGAVKSGCAEDRVLVLQNAGDAPLALSALSLSSGDAEITALGSLAATTLAPGASLQLGFRFSPGSAGARSRTLTVSSDDADEPTVACSLAGTGTAADHVVDSFQQEVQRRADVLFVVDNSGSMVEEQSTLAASFPDFVDALDADGVSYHLGVVTSDNPYLAGSPRIVTPSTSSPAATFAQNAMVGTSGYGYEQPLLSARYALTAPIANGWNAGFLRPEAKLFVVFVGDEDDQSSGSVAFYAATYQSVKAAPSMTRAYSIAGPVNGSCTTAFPGYRLAQIAGTLGGSSGDICASNFAPVLADIADVAAEPRVEFPLSQTPVAGTIVVTVEGVVQPASAWSWDAAHQTIVFQPGHVPADGATFTVEYDVSCY